jgi:hypothetical protein
LPKDDADKDDLWSADAASDRNDGMESDAASITSPEKTHFPALNEN